MAAIGLVLVVFVFLFLVLILIRHWIEYPKWIFWFTLGWFVSRVYYVAMNCAKTMDNEKTKP